MIVGYYNTSESEKVSDALLLSNQPSAIILFDIPYQSMVYKKLYLKEICI